MLTQQDDIWLGTLFVNTGAISSLSTSILRFFKLGNLLNKLNYFFLRGTDMRKLSEATYITVSSFDSLLLFEEVKLHFFFNFFE